jgi:hypothetical protein
LHTTLISNQSEEKHMSNRAPLRKGAHEPFWSTTREATLNWLALGLLLAAWNASDNDATGNSAVAAAAANAHRRPEALRGYSQVSVRAVSRVAVRP